VVIGDELHHQEPDEHDPTTCHLCPGCAARLAELHRIVLPLGALVGGLGDELGKGASPLAVLAQLIRR
jgi:hypothetical protein